MAKQQNFISPQDIHAGRRILNARMEHLRRELKTTVDIPKRQELQGMIKAFEMQDALLEEEGFRLTMMMCNTIIKRNEAAAKMMQGKNKDGIIKAEA